MQEACVYLQIPGSICKIYDSIRKLIIVYCSRISFLLVCLQESACYLQLSSSICRMKPAICSLLRSICRISGSICKSTMCAVSVQYAVLLFAECSLLFAAYFVFICRIPSFICKSTMCAVSVQYAVLLFAESTVLFANLLSKPFSVLMQFVYLQNPANYL